MISNTPLPTTAAPPPKLLDQVRAKVRLKHYSIRTKSQYAYCVKRVTLFLEKRHPKDTGVAKAGAFLSPLAVGGNVAASTQNYALSALLFLYRDVLGADLAWMSEVIRAKRPARLPAVLKQREVALLLDRFSGAHGLIAWLLYGTGMRSRSAGDCGEQDRRAASGCRWSAWAYLLSVDQPMAGASGVQYAPCLLRGLPCAISSKLCPC